MNPKNPFSVEELEKEIEKLERSWNRKYKFNEIELDTYENDYFDEELEDKQLKIIEWRELWAQFEERQRLKADVERILDDDYPDIKDGKDRITFIKWKDRLKSKLGLSQEEKK